MNKLFLLFLSLAFCTGVLAQDRSSQSLAPTPPLGWNSWNFFEGRISSKIMREMADAMVANGMQAAGYTYLVIDDIWVGGRDSHNRLYPDPVRFPEGMKALADYVHSKGLKLGIYSDAAELTCAGYTGSYNFEQQDAQTFADWGIDYFKYDYCNAPPDVTTAFERYKKMGDALRATGRPIVYSICEWGQRKPWLWARAAGGQLWRTTFDSRDAWKTGDASLVGIMDIFDLQEGLEGYAGNGGWNDPDLLMVGLYGKGSSSSVDGRFKGCTLAEYRSHFALWCMLAAPLMVNLDLRNVDTTTLALLTNKELLSIDQDRLGKQGYIIYKKDSIEVLKKELAGGAIALCVVNRAGRAIRMPLDIQSALDIWTPFTRMTTVFAAKTGKYTPRLQVSLDAHGCEVFRLERPETRTLTRIILKADSTVLNPVQYPAACAHLSVTGVFSDGRTAVLPAGSVVYGARNKLASGRDAVVVLDGDKVIPREGGMATVTATVGYGGIVDTASLDIEVRPYYRDYHQTLVLKLFMGMEGKPVARLAGQPPFIYPHADVLCTFEQALDVIRRVDHLTEGIPKIVYLVGWQKGGHDHLYPSWDSVNTKLKRPQDSTALESLRWLIVAARQYHTTVSLHINMVDAYKSSPLWDEYVKKDVFARDTNGQLLARDIQIQGDSMYIVSYTREWEAGLAQQRIDRLIAMVPELKAGHTIHIDAFIDKPEHGETLSPWHAMREHGGIDIYAEAQTQHKIFRYWRARGFDVTGEGIFWAHPPGEGFYGLQPMSWWYPTDISYQMETPEDLSARGGTDRHGDGDFRFGNSMHGEEIFQKSLDSLPDFLGQFCRNTLPWYYLSRLRRLAFVRDTLFYSDGVQAATIGGHKIIRRGSFVLHDDNDLFVPALWLPHTIIAYSETGYVSRSWRMPEDWKGVAAVDIYRITQGGAELLASNRPVREGRLDLRLNAREAVSIVPHTKAMASSAEHATAAPLNLWYRQPAKIWEACLPLGNGRLGATPDGGIRAENIVLNDITLWSGGPQDADRQDAAKYLPRIRQLLFDGKNDSAEVLINRAFVCQGEGSGRGNGADVPYGSYQVLGNLHLNYDYAQGGPGETASGYSRTLSIDSALASCSFQLGGVTYRREYFTSFSGDVIMIRISADKPGQVGLSLSLDRPERYAVSVHGQELDMAGQLNNGTNGQGMKYLTRVRMVPEGGRLFSGDSTLRVKSANAVVIYVSSATNFRGVDYMGRSASLLREAMGNSYRENKEGHVRAYRKLFGRTALFLGDNGSSAAPTDERLLAFVRDSSDNALPALYFQYGRYLMISSTRPGLLPPNLQGLWANTVRTPWNGDYHLDINIQMNHWPLEVANLAMLNEPFYTLVKGLVPNGERTAKAYYGGKGWVAHVITNVWGYTSPGEDAGWGATNIGSGWLCQMLWTHYAFTKDTAYLRQIYPILKGSAEFYLSTMVREPVHGWLVTAPSNSPENAFRLPDGNRASICMGPTIDNEIIRELFRDVTEAGKTLRVDTAFRRGVETAVSQLAPDQIAPDGRLQEWLVDYPETEPHHRHVSHLWGLYPGGEVSPAATPALAKAEAASLIARGDLGTGWSLAWKNNLWARLEDGNHAFRLLQDLLRPIYGTQVNMSDGGGTYPNLFCGHPPFQIDGNFGGCAGIAEMLLQSSEGYINLLPAIPDVWKAGHFEGLCVRGGAEVSARWAEHRVTDVNVLATATGEFRIRVPEGVQKIRLRQRGEVVEKRPDGKLLDLHLRKGEQASMVFLYGDNS